MKKVLPNIHMLRLGSVNAYLIEGEELTLIDTGTPGSETKIFDYIHKIGRNPGELSRIIITHCHPDHAGSAAALKEATRAKIYMHESDAEMVLHGIGVRQRTEITPGLANKLIYNAFIKTTSTKIPGFSVDHFLEPDDLLPVVGGLRVLHFPGHSAGQIALITEKNELLFAADTCSNLYGLTVLPFNENLQQALHDLKVLSKLHFEVAFFGHGSPILSRASDRFRSKFASKQTSKA